MARIIRFLDFVEIKTKIASCMPFLVGLVYALYLHNRIDLLSTALFFVAMLLFDMATTAINNTVDARRAHDRTKAHYSKLSSVFLIVLLVGLAAALGLALTVLHGVVVLAVGALCFLAGITYTYGPVPVSRTPFGEVISGFVMGFFITFLVVYVNSPRDMLVRVSSFYPTLAVGFELPALAGLLLVCLPAICGVANIMAANNLCDLEADRQEGRKTLPVCVGKKWALRLFAARYVLGFAAVPAAALLRVLPYTCLAALVFAVPVTRNTARFWQKQVKAETFGLSVVNLAWLTGPYVLLIFTGCLI